MFKREKKMKQEDEGRRDTDFGEVLAVTAQPLFLWLVPRGCLPLYTCSYLHLLFSCPYNDYTLIPTDINPCLLPACKTRL
jgi:hypothetical protein